MQGYVSNCSTLNLTSEPCIYPLYKAGESYRCSTLYGTTRNACYSGDDLLAIHIHLFQSALWLTLGVIFDLISLTSNKWFINPHNIKLSSLDRGTSSNINLHCYCKLTYSLLSILYIDANITHFHHCSSKIFLK